ncbi:MAG: sugar transferase [Chloroflexota bacterium]|nr:sugar transferase [Chloroflexota bacterium]
MSPLAIGGPTLQQRAIYVSVHDRVFERAAKRVLDVVVAGALLALLWPLLLVAALLVRLSSSGPILFHQERIGRDGKPFTLYKFRTMLDKNDPSVHRAYVQALIGGEAAAVGGTFKLLHDARITRTGRMLRRFSLDELPQLFNVLNGSMSLVGPRPALAYEVDAYGDRERQRLSVTPGITGLWQVSGRATLNFHQMIAFDLAYIDGWSLGLDLEILRRTPAAVLSGRGAC